MKPSDNPILDFLLRVRSFRYTDIPETPGNSNLGASHEREIRKLLESTGFQRMELPLSDFTKQDILEKKAFSNIIEPSFLKNPLGGSKHPDFVLFTNTRVFYLELKSSKSSYNPKWGSTFPEGKDIWIFTCGNRNVNETTFFLGGDLISAEDARDMKLEQESELARSREKSQGWKKRTGFIGLDLQSQRFTDSSKKEASLMFHPNRKLREARVYDYIWPGFIELDGKMEN